MNRPLPAPLAGRGFTVIELLITIGIIGILVALLVPGWQNIRAAANAATCAQNLRQIGLAVHQFAQDNDNLIISSVSSRGVSWWQNLAPYLGAKTVGAPLPGNPWKSVYMCPVTKRNHDGTGATEYSSGGYLTRYNINYHIAAFETGIAQGGVYSTFRQTRLSQMVSPSKTFLAGDLFGNGGGAYWMVTDGELTYPHQGRVNMLFLDDHVEALDPQRMSYLGSKPYHIFWRGFDWGYPGYATD